VDVTAWLLLALLVVSICNLIAVMACFRVMNALVRDSRHDREGLQRVLLSSFSDLLAALRSPYSEGDERALHNRRQLK
jgi:hypothetical protein